MNSKCLSTYFASAYYRFDPFQSAGDSGVIAVPVEKAEEVLKMAQNIEATEQKIIAEVKCGSSLKDARAKLGYHHLQSKE